MMCNIWPEALAIQKGLDSICIGIDNKKLCEIAGEASKYRIEIQQQLAAAQAELAAEREKWETQPAYYWQQRCYQQSDSFQKDYACLKKVCRHEKKMREQAEAKLNETYTDENGTVWTRPTAEAYCLICKAYDTWKTKAEQAEARIIGLEKELSDCKKMEGVSYQLRESLREEISSANARIAELEDFREFVIANIGGAENEDDVVKHLVQLRTHIFDMRKRAEQAEENLAWVLQNYCDECGYDPEICRGTQPDVKCAVRALDDSKGAQILAENKRMREALERIANTDWGIFNPDYVLIAQQALRDAK